MINYSNIALKLKIYLSNISIISKTNDNKPLKEHYSISKSQARLTYNY